VEKVQAKANPEKRLFISLLTRDISLVAAVLDLIDNSINAAVEPVADQLPDASGYVKVLQDPAISPTTNIYVKMSPDNVLVQDTASGISLATAQEHVFKFGRSASEEKTSDRLSVYGLGLKRAFFKIGNHIEIVSDHESGGFSLDLYVNDWEEDDTVPWHFELEPRPPTPREKCGTRISISELYPETSKRIGDGIFLQQLKNEIGKTYSFFLLKFVNIFLNDEKIAATELRVGQNNETSMVAHGNVTCSITAGLGIAEGGTYKDAGAGWFVFCNGRAVVHSDKTPLTGWTTGGLGIFQPKHRPFLGTVYFVSEHADELPWDTTKSRINEDSEVWQIAKRAMIAVARPVVTFLDRRYSNDGTMVEAKELSEVSKGPVSALTASTVARSTFTPPKKQAKQTTRIQYDALLTDVERITNYLSKPSMSGSDVGRHTFNFFLRNEVGEE
jgi:Histidine kinase-, DNA gyrase B-, and HSP90-like ATPase